MEYVSLPVPFDDYLGRCSRYASSRSRFSNLLTLGRMTVELLWIAKGAKREYSRSYILPDVT